jgi:3-deoxy-7-phosphoheptulonate synthase
MMPENPNVDRYQAENTHIRELNTLLPPEEVKLRFPASEMSLATVINGREAFQDVFVPRETYAEQNDKLIVVPGPCSIHDPVAALEYAVWVLAMREEYGEELEIVMRMYFEKPRTTVGWKGLINDPNLDLSFDINKGLLIARELASDITNLGVPVGTELLDTMTPQYFAGLISWGAIGARTTESQLHRELASGLSFPLGFKNGTSGNTQVAVDAVSAAAHPHHFLAITNEGRAAIAITSGNP